MTDMRNGTENAPTVRPLRRARARCAHALVSGLILIGLAPLIQVGAARAEVTEGQKLGDTTVDELIEELRGRGVLPAEAAEDQSAGQSANGEPEAGSTDERLAKALALLDRLDFYGDFRGRYEGFVFSNDTFGDDRDSRHRLRYRLRLGLKADINDYFDLETRLETGPDANSGNQTLGSGVDWDPDGVFINRVVLTFHPFGARDIPCCGTEANLRFGKMSNPFRPSEGVALLVWDSDISPEGIAMTWGMAPTEDTTLDLDFAYFVAEERSVGDDPFVLATRLGGAWHATSDIEAGGGVAYYAWRDVDQGFLDRGSYAADGFGKGYGGNVPGGLTDDSEIDIVHANAYAKYTGVADWPVTVYSELVHNASAEDTAGFSAGREDLGWSAGALVGSKKKWVELGAGYFHLEANAAPANFVDSDLFDGKTNGEGWVLHVKRQIFENTELKFETFVGDALDNHIYGVNAPVAPNDTPDGFDSAVADMHRVRFRLDAVVKF